MKKTLCRGARKITKNLAVPENDCVYFAWKIFYAQNDTRVEEQNHRMSRMLYARKFKLVLKDSQVSLLTFFSLILL